MELSSPALLHRLMGRQQVLSQTGLVPRRPSFSHLVWCPRMQA